MATAAFETPKLKEYPVIPLIQVGATSHLKPFVAAAPIQKALGFPETLVEDWQAKAIAKMGELLGKYRSLRVYMDSCVHCGASPTSATISSAPVTRRTCRWHART
jgi:hypothetical protein